ncbi:MAG: FMN-binding protein [Candidatus Binatia bacterium]
MTHTRAEAKAFYSKPEALALAFPDADTVENHTFFLTDEQVKQIEALAQTTVDSKLVTIYTGRKGEQVLGYALIDTHIVRTLPETFLIVLAPDGTVRKLHVLAFYEPQEYLPSARWLRQFEQKTLNLDLRLQRDIHGIAGATLSARAVTSGVRKALALFQVLIQQRQ